MNENKGSKKFSNAQVSRILSAHENGQLCTGGGGNGLPASGCLFQVALNNADLGVGAITHLRRRAKDAELVNQFDDNYQPSWSTKKFVNFLAKNKLI